MSQRPRPAHRPRPSAGLELHVLALNSGSSSLKFGLYRARGADARCLLSGEAQGLGGPTASFQASDAQGTPLLHEPCAMANAAEAMVRIGKLLKDGLAPVPQAVGHRIVHGGPHLLQHCLIGPAVLKQLESAEAFAPLHTPAALALICDATAHFPARPQVACLDTCFHTNMPPVASTLPLPRELRDAGIRRYGFHGLSRPAAPRWGRSAWRSACCPARCVRGPLQCLC